MAPRVIVVGGSIGGLATALALRAAGAQVTVLERRVDMSDQGTGLALRPEAIDGLRELGVQVSGRPLRAWRYAVDIAGGVRVRVERDAPVVAYTYSALRAAMLERARDLDLRTDARATAVEPTERGARVRVGDDALEADLVVGADGVDSLVQRMLFPDLAPESLGIAMWRGFLGEDEAGRVFGAPALEEFLGRNVQLFARIARGWWVGFLVPERAPGAGRRFGWVCYMREPADMDALMTDAQGASHRWFVPPGTMGERAISGLERMFAASFPAPIAELARTGMVNVQRVVRLIVPAMARGRIALVGDAAHVVPPFTTAGASLAIGDAVALACACSRELSEASLAAWNTERLGAARAILSQADHLIGLTIDRAPDLEKLSSAAAVSWARAIAGPNAAVNAVDELLWPRHGTSP